MHRSIERPCVFRLTDAEAALSRKFAANAIDDIKVDPRALSSDLHTTAEYRVHAVAVMLKRAVEAAAQTANSK